MEKKTELKSRTVTTEQLIETLRAEVSDNSPSLRLTLPNGMYGFVYTPYEDLVNGAVGRVYLPEYGNFADLWAKLEKDDLEVYIDLCVLCDKELVPIIRLDWTSFSRVGYIEWYSWYDEAERHYPVEFSEYGYRMKVRFRTSDTAPLIEGETILFDLDDVGRLKIDGQPSDYWVGYKDGWWVFVLKDDRFLPIVDIHYQQDVNGFDLEPLDFSYRGCCE
ncbi:MAG: hypothetical protein CFK48_07635 [Armatimonadetes bacterium CP1_7O]|nr:MAG: hypothetical protein CFK48_07635 [Armatimonadetes bacterium CP1_7O]